MKKVTNLEIAELEPAVRAVKGPGGEYFEMPANELDSDYVGAQLPLSRAARRTA